MVSDTSKLERVGVRLQILDERAPPLTSREYDILRLIAAGRENAEIAVELHFALGTIKVHVRDILAKLGSSSRTEAAVRAVRLRLI